MQRHVAGLDEGPRKEALGVLAERLVSYQHGLEQGEPAPLEDPSQEAEDLSAALAQLRPHVRLLSNLKGLVGR